WPDDEPSLSSTVAGKPFTTRVLCPQAGPSQYAKSFTCQAIRWQNLLDSCLSRFWGYDTTREVGWRLISEAEAWGLRAAVNQ
ncbi:MAG: hypothetical protein C4337_08130, partial [Armatimonadota bacterium]